MNRTVFFIFLILLLSISGCVTPASSISRALRISQLEKKIQQEYREGFVKNHPELPEKTKQAILNKKIFIGMTKEQVFASWGKPQDINRDVGSWGVHEQWIYGKFSHSTYLYFENDILTSFQD